MVLYFSGTGNSKAVAERLAAQIGDSVLFILDVDFTKINPPSDQLILVFPIYSWGVPPLILNIIENLPQSFCEEINLRQLTVQCVMTCGDEVGLAPEMFLKGFKKKGVTNISVWSVIMPNNYVLLPGFNVDSKSLEDKKLEAMEPRVKEIAVGILNQMKTIDVTRGSVPAIKTKLVYPLFKKWGIIPSKWHYTDKCIGCGKCSEVCHYFNIKMNNGHPVWGNHCCSCLACYHICPVHAVEYGRETRKKGQYFCPLIKI